MTTRPNPSQTQRFKEHTGAFIAALDQSGGSTPGALEKYGVSRAAWTTEEEMYALVHAMRSRIMTSPAFRKERILAAILFENTLDRQVLGHDTADYLWEEKEIVPILKIDQGLLPEEGGVRKMKPMPGLEPLLKKAVAKHVFGTKMRSVILQSTGKGIADIVRQQFEVAKIILDHGLVPIIEPEIDIHCPDKEAAESLLVGMLGEGLESLSDGQQIIFKLTLPEVDNLYAPFVEHARVLKVVALSGGYDRHEANSRLARQQGVVASFSRALAEGLSAQQSDEEFNAMLNDSIESIYQASAT